MTSPAQTVALVTGLPEDELAGRPAYQRPDLRVSFEGARRNFTLDIRRLARDLRHEISPRLCDLIEIAATVYAADLAFKRGENEDWVRSVSLLIPVRDPDLWRSVEPQLCGLLYSLSHDNCVLEFCRRVEPGESVRPSEAGVPGGFDCVALLSGGIDSFAGATALLATGRSPLFVAHRPQNAVISAAQRHVCQCLGQRFGRHVRLIVNRARPVRTEEGEGRFPSPEARESSQRTRSLLYLSLGAAACEAAGVGQLVCAENGVLAINPPLSEARVGGNSTAGVRPRVLARFSDLLRAMGLSVEVQNPFLYQTKGQLLRDVLRKHFSARQIQGAVSCWMAGRASRPCGGCVPCLVRAVSMHAAGLPPEAHGISPLDPASTVGTGTDAHANLVELVGFARRVSASSDAELLRLCPVLLELPPGGNVSGAIDLLRRFTAEVNEATANLPLARA
jgi:7-cyano-7-deazaguanine synthase in queuosine biosynthesis